MADAKQLAADLRAQRQIIQSVRTGCEPAFYERSERDLIEKIAHYQKLLDASRERRKNAPAIIATAKRRITEIKRQQNQKSIDELLRLKNEVQAVEG